MQKRINILIGPPITGGKSYLASLASRENDTVTIDGKRGLHNFTLSGVNESTILIVIDDVDIDMLDAWVALFYNDTLAVDRQGKKRIYVDTPQVIITCQASSSDFKTIPGSMERRVMIIETNMVTPRPH